MRIITGCLITVLFACAYTSLFAQTTFTALQGRVFTDRNPAEGATVVLLKYPDSAVVKSVLSNKSGLFYFDRLAAGRYLVFITKLNYKQTYSGPYELDAGKSRDVGFIKLSSVPNQLKEVSITGKKDFVEVRTDKTVLNVSQNVMSAGASLYDVLNTAPGVKV